MARSAGIIPSEGLFAAPAIPCKEKGFGLYDYNARYYSPYLGRFISPDSIVPEPGSSSGFNRYRYTRNNPLKYTDPSGHCVWDVCIVELAIIGAGIALAVDFSIQAKANYDSGMSFGEAVYYENIDTQHLGVSMLGGAAGGAAGATVVPAVGSAAGATAAGEAAVWGATEATASTIGTVTTVAAEATTAGAVNVAVNSSERTVLRAVNGENISTQSIVEDVRQNSVRDFTVGAASNLVGKVVEGRVNYVFPPNNFAEPVPTITNVRFNWIENTPSPSLPGDQFHRAINAGAQMGAQLATDEDVLDLLVP